MSQSAETFATTLRPGEAVILELIRARGVIRASDVAEQGVHHQNLRSLERRGLIERRGRGLYGGVGSGRGDEQLLEASRLVPQGVVCLLSALSVHRMTTELPWEVWLAIPRKSWTPRIARPPIRTVHYPDYAYAVGIEEVRIGDAPVRVYSAAKTVVDCFRFNAHIGTDVAIAAIKAYRERGFPPQQLSEFAAGLRVADRMRPYLEALWA